MWPRVPKRVVRRLVKTSRFVFVLVSLLTGYYLLSCTKINIQVRSALQGVSEWFDEYMAKEELTPGQEPEMYKAMVLTP